MNFVIKKFKICNLKKWFLSYLINKKGGGGGGGRGGLCIKPKYLPHFVEGRYNKVYILWKGL